MVNADRQSKRWKIAHDIEDELKTKLPQFSGKASLIGMSVSPPRPYMGRFDSGKKRWTIDLRDNVTFSRMQQVGVDVDEETGVWTYDDKKLSVKIALLEEIVATHQKQLQERANLRSEIPQNLPKGVSVSTRDDGTFTVTFERWAISKEKMIALVELLRTIPQE